MGAHTQGWAAIPPTQSACTLSDIPEFSPMKLYTYHYTGIILMNAGPKLYERIGGAMLFALTVANYAPATLSVYNLSINSLESREPRSSINQAISSSFDKLLRAEHPDALTLHGRFILNKGNQAEALRHFDLAIASAAKAGGAYAVHVSESPGTAKTSPKSQSASDDGTNGEGHPRDPLWAWEAACHRERAKILAGLGRTEEALKSLRIAALELADADAHLALGQLSTDSDLAHEHLVIAAQSMSRAACVGVAAREEEKASTPGLSRSARSIHRAHAKQWALLAQELPER